MKNLKNKIIGSFIGLAVGDCLGASVEFKKRGTFPEIKDMIGGGPFNLKIGEWTDDTIMAVCLAESLVKNKGLNDNHVLDLWLSWYQNGYNSPTGHCFDIGATTASSLRYFSSVRSPIPGINNTACGNGSIMRLSPATMFYCKDTTKAIDLAWKQGNLTHNSITANECCKLLATYILKGYNSENIFNNIKNFSTDKNVNEIASGKYKEKYIDDIKSSGYCIHTLESAIWSVYNSKSFSEAILKAVNLGDDSDSVGAVTGQIAGALYGIDNIPSEWIDKLYRKEYLLDLGEKLYDLGQQN